MIVIVKKICITWLLLYAFATGNTQPRRDSLLEQLARSAPDTNRVTTLSLLSLTYLQTDNKLSIKYAEEGIALAKKLNFKSGEADCLRRSGIAYFIQGRYPEALDIFQRAMAISESINQSFGIAAGNGHIGNIYVEQGDYKMARFYYNKHLQISLASKNRQEEANALKRIAESYLKEGELDSATVVFGKVYNLLDALKDERIAGGVSSVLKDLGQLDLKKGNVQGAMNYFRQGIPIAKQTDNNNVLSDIYLEMAGVFKSAGNADSSIYYALHSLQAGKQNRYAKNILAAAQFLALAYEPIDAKEALQFHKQASAINDSLFNTAKATQVHNLFFLEQQRKQQLELSQTMYNNRLKLYSVMGAAFLFLAGVVVLYRMNRNKQKANTILNSQKQEIQNQRSKAEKALEDLQAAQAQLIQAEKMASLGEMTAGIAHEIQNPLNFVNNFSEVNEGLIEELKLQKAKTERDDGLENELLNDLAQNSSKIKMHGKRADSIVKGMLEHSRIASGVKEPMDINAIAAEFLQLAYHGLRAADKSFNTAMITDFDTTISTVPVIPQDMGRVLLNLYNNAFYAVNEKIKEKNEKYKPSVTVRTKREEGNVLLIVEDNGNGIPKNIIDKIFQPFFTTKPAGQGTGLGLSLTYDIVKAHGGDITVQSTQGEGTAFIVRLPASK